LQTFLSNIYTSCCQACSCAKDCVIKGNCCPDYIPDEKVNTIRQGECFAMDTLLTLDNAKAINNTKLIALSNNISHAYYKLVDYCPLSTPYGLAERCTTPKTLEEHTPVSSRDREKLFLNKYCAYCHGYKGPVSWKLFLSVDCMSLHKMSFQTFDESDMYILKKCYLRALPPSLFYTQKVKCHPNPVSSCPSHDTNTDLSNAGSLCLKPEEACKNTLYRRTDAFELWYKNIYCYLCRSSSPLPISR